MTADQRYLVDSAEARRRAFELIQELQAGDPSAASALAALTERADAAGWAGVVRIGLFGRAVHSWITRAPSLRADVDAVIGAGRRAGDACTTALGLALRAAFVSDGLRPASPAFDRDLAEAVVVLEGADGGALEMISAHTACGIAFDYRSLWELGDEEYAAALRLADSAEPGIGDTLLAAVMFNRAEAHVSWACRLRQLGDYEGLAERWRAWSDVSARSVSFAMPQAWHAELMTLGFIMAALAGIDVATEAESALAGMGPGEDRRAAGHLELARALSLVGRSGVDREYRRRVLGHTLEAIDPDAFPLLHDLALFLAAEVEADGGLSYGLQCAQLQIRHRWTDRVAQLGAMRSRIAAERMGRELDRVSLELTRDELTGIGNRRALAAFTAGLEESEVDRVGVIMVDVDRFKTVNDRYGHHVGDAVLARIGAVLEQGVRPADLAVRLGGDEFMVVLTAVDADVAAERAARLMDEVDRQPWAELSPGLAVTVSMGVAGGRRIDLDAVRAVADRAVYGSKRSGGHEVTRGGPSI